MGQQRQLVDEQPHPVHLGLHPFHGVVELVLVTQAALDVQVDPAVQGRERRAQLVARVGDEAAQPVLGASLGGERVLDGGRDRGFRAGEQRDADQPPPGGPVHRRTGRRLYPKPRTVWTIDGPPKSILRRRLETNRSTTPVSPPKSYCQTWSRICALETTRPVLASR